MLLFKTFNDYTIDISDDTFYDLNSVDNLKQYKKSYTDGNDEDLTYLTKHGIQTFRDGDLYNSASICAGGGNTAIHDTGILIEDGRLIICCASVIFCLDIPELDLIWKAKVDSATCFEIFKYNEDYIVHGELEISRLDQSGKVLWQFSGADIFTTLKGENDFQVLNDIIVAIDWSGKEYRININTGEGIPISQ